MKNKLKGDLPFLIKEVAKELKEKFPDNTNIKFLRKNYPILYGKIHYIREQLDTEFENVFLKPYKNVALGIELPGYNFKDGKTPTPEKYDKTGELKEKQCSLCGIDRGLLPIDNFDYNRANKAYYTLCRDCQGIKLRLGRIKGNEKRAILAEDFNKEYVYELYHHIQKRRCFYTKQVMEIRSELGTSQGQLVLSLDRVLNDHREYTKNNVVLCINWFNTLKSNFSIDTFYKFLLLVQEHFDEMKNILFRLARLSKENVPTDRELFQYINNTIEAIELLREHNYNVDEALKERFK